MFVLCFVNIFFFYSVVFNLTILEKLLITAFIVWKSAAWTLCKISSFMFHGGTKSHTGLVWHRMLIFRWTIPLKLYRIDSFDYLCLRYSQEGTGRITDVKLGIGICSISIPLERTDSVAVVNISGSGFDSTERQKKRKLLFYSISNLFIL